MSKVTVDDSVPLGPLGFFTQALGLPAPGVDGIVGRVCTDSRQLRSGDLFVALTGPHHDGHGFVAGALAQGAVAAVVSQNWYDGQTGDRTRLLAVPDPLDALARMARAHREAVAPTVVAITGSNGKTTVKEMVASMLRQAAQLQGESPEQTVWATPGNFNNQVGLPLTLLGLRPSHRWAVLEMGMNHEGELTDLSRLASPDVALITNVHRAHLGPLGSIEAVAAAKGELFVGLKQAGVALIPQDSGFDRALGRHLRQQTRWTFGLSSEATVRGHDVGAVLEIEAPEGRRLSVRLAVPGRHNRINAVAAAAIGFALSLSDEAIQSGLESFAGVPGRLQSVFSALGALIIDDTYNANPDSVTAAIEVLAARPGRRILVLGDLGELGEAGPRLHGEIGELAQRSGVDDCLTVGEASRETAAGFGSLSRHFESVESLVAFLRPQLNAQTVVLVKGSRFMRMERIVKGLIE